MRTSDLIIEGVSLAPLALRNCEESLTFAKLGDFKRTINGSLVYLQGADKIHSVIKGQDILPITLMVPGSVLMVSCLSSIIQSAPSGDPVMPIRPFVEGSLKAHSSTGETCDFIIKDGMVVVEKTERESTFFSFRPLLKMYLKTISNTCTEWEAKHSWIMELEEV